jgi:6-pyruvoyltetrahydropterin/6-carboxytetrahydropterin synthase
MIATVAKQFTFDAAHHLDTLPPEHKCHRLHGHTYRVEIALTGPVEPDGFVIDYADIDRLWLPLHEQLDHRLLNAVPGLEIPSTEHVAGWIWAHLRLGCMARPDFGKLHLARVRVFESTSTWCEVTSESIVDVARYARPGNS